MHQTTDGNFIHSFLDKGRLSFLLEQIPVYAVMDQSLGQVHVGNGRGNR